MNLVDYQAHAGQLFIIPVHPGAAPHHLANATGPQIAETIRLFNQNITEHTLYHAVSTAIKAQLLHAVDNTYLQYGQLTPEALETNRSALSKPWNPDEPLETLWKKITEIQRVATAGAAPITDIAIITLTLAMFKKSGLLMLTTQQWRLRPMAQWTLVTFKTDFTLANTERIRQETAGSAGYHGANSAAIPPPSPAQSPAPFPASPEPAPLLPPLLPILPATSLSTAARCTIAGHMGSASTRPTLPPLVTTKPTATKIRLLHSICKVVTTELAAGVTAVHPRPEIDTEGNLHPDLAP